MDCQQLVTLRLERFAELPLDCGRSESPGIVEPPEWREWADYATTAGQLRIERYLDRVGVEGKSILHIGVGNSGLALRFAGHASLVVGTSIGKSEVRRAAALHLRNYRAVLHNKYSGPSRAVRGRFDFIIDNNPTSFCCCLKHAAAMLDFYASKLANGGQVVTDRNGLLWKIDSPDAADRWRFDFDDLAALARLSGLKAYRASDDIYILARGRPRMPTPVSNARFYARRLARLGRRLPLLAQLPWRSQASSG